MQKLFAGELLAHYYFALNAKPNQVEDRLPDINADGVYLHGTPPVYASYTPEEAADHPINYDYSVNNLIEAISNQRSNLFTGSGTGDQGGLGLDIPDAASARTRVLGYATKLRAGLAAVNGHLGNTGRNVRDALQYYINNGF